MGRHYFFFPTPMYISVSCKKGSYTSTISGHFSIPKVCSLSSSRVTTTAEVLHMGFMSNPFKRIYTWKWNISNISSVPYITNSISPLTFANLSEMETAVHSSLPVYLHPYVHYPSFLLPLVINLVLLIILFCFYKRLLFVYNFLKTRIPLEETGQDTMNEQD